MAKARTIEAVVRELCLAFPDAEEFVSHGSPNYRATKGKTFATYLVNHHGDGRIALWLPMPPGAQDSHVKLQPKHFFVPPYVGPRGWLGVNLDTGNFRTADPYGDLAKLAPYAIEGDSPSRLRRPAAS